MRVARQIIRVAVCAFCVVAAYAQDGEPQTAGRKPFLMPKVATSADGFVNVVAADVPGDPMGFRLPILGFATRSIRELERVYGLDMPRRDGAGLAIHAMDGRTNDTRVIARAFRQESGLVTRIWLPSPGFSDIDLLRFEIAKAYFASWVERSAPHGVTPGELPDWFVQGALRAADSQTAHDDVRFVLKLWSSARLFSPRFARTCAWRRDLRPHCRGMWSHTCTNAICSSPCWSGLHPVQRGTGRGLRNS